MLRHSGTPVRNRLATMAVHVLALAPSRTALECSATFQPAGLPESDAVDLIEVELAAPHYNRLRLIQPA